MSAHTAECGEAHRQARGQRREYRREWPAHCRYCGGWGGFEETFDPSPRGVSLGPGCLHDFDPCPECAEKGYCARCGLRCSTAELAEGAPCPHCGFVAGRDEGVPPPAPVCAG